MSTIVPIAISIIRCDNRYLFLKRKNPPYENLWSMIGGKIGIGEHIVDAAKREIMEETGAQEVNSYGYRGMVSERLVLADNTLSAHFLIFVGSAEISDYREDHREGELGPAAGKLTARTAAGETGSQQDEETADEGGQEAPARAAALVHPPPGGAGGEPPPPRRQGRR